MSTGRRSDDRRSRRLGHGRAASVLLVGTTALATALGVQAAQVPTAAAAPSGTPSDTPSSSSSPRPSPASAPASERSSVTGPTVVDDVGTVSLSGVQTVLPGSTDDTAGSAPIETDLTVFPSDQLSSLPTGSSILNDGHFVGYAGFGNFQIEEGRIRFQPGGQTGTRSVRYRITDADGLTDEGLVTVTVTAGGELDLIDATQATPVTVDLLQNDTAGRDADGSVGALDRTSVRFPTDQPVPVTVSADGRVATLPGVGVFSVDPVGGLVTFAPAVGYVSGGYVGRLHYTAQDTTRDADGRTEHHAYTTDVVWRVVPLVVLSVFPSVSPESFSHVGQVLSWTARVTNTGSSALEGLTVVDSSTRWSARTCTPVPVAGTLPPGRSTTCTATSTVRQADLDQRTAELRGVVTVRGTTTRDGQTFSTQAQAGEVVLGLPRQGLTLTASASPTAVSRVGQRVDYTFVARNTGNLSLSELIVRAPFPGLSAPVCSPVPQGGTLGDSRSTTCSATRTTTVADLRAPVLPGTAKATASPPRALGHVRAITTVGTVVVAVRALAPVATSDTVAAVDDGPSVVLPGAANDTAGEPGGPAPDVSRTVLVGTPDATYGDKVTTTAEGRWSVLPDGSVRFEPSSGSGGTTAQVAYRVYDQAGRSSVGRLRVPLRAGADGRGDVVVATPQGRPVDADVLSGADPGQDASGARTAFDATSVRLTSVWPRAGYAITYVADRRSIRIADVGAFVVAGDGRIRFTPVPTFHGATPRITWTAKTLAGTTAAARLSVTVQQTTGGAAPARPVPVAVPDQAVTTSQIRVALRAQLNDLPGPSALDGTTVSFPRDQLGRLPAGSAISVVEGEQQLVVPGQGTYRTYRQTDSGAVWFTPAAGFVGDAVPVDYSIADTAGRVTRAPLTVTVLAGALARPDVATTRQGQPVDVDVLRDDDPGGSPQTGTPPTWLDPRLTDEGLPAGSTLSADGARLDVPGQGAYAVSPGDRTVTFVPEPRFRGTAAEVTLALRVSVPVAYADPAVVELRSTLTVTVQGSDPVARPDTASTSVGQPVVVPVLSNDGEGVGAVPLVGSSVRLRLAPGLPQGSTLYGDAKTLVVAGRGTFLVSGNGQLTFVPLGTTTGPVPVVGYQVADANGSTARSTLAVTVGS